MTTTLFTSLVTLLNTLTTVGQVPVTSTYVIGRIVITSIGLFLITVIFGLTLYWLGHNIRQDDEEGVVITLIPLVLELLSIGVLIWRLIVFVQTFQIFF